jgi:RNA 3'-terminal phosphate cyclase (ATP)
MIEASHANVTELFTGFGEKGVSAESVADTAATQARHYLESTAAVGEHLADQMLLPLALAGGGAFTTVSASSHLLTNIAVIEKFLPIEITCTLQSAGSVMVEVS